MFSTVEIISILAAGFGILFGLSGWRKSDNKDAERLGVIETKLESILDDLKCLISKIDRSDSHFSVIDQKIAKLEEQVKTCFSLIEKEK
jgi:archaellum component FlaC